MGRSTDFPIWPDKKASWIASIIITFLLFPFYYLVLYPNLIDNYYKQFWLRKPIPTTSYPTNECIPDLEPGAGIAQANLEVRIPKYVADFMWREILVNIKNGECYFEKPIIVKATAIEAQNDTSSNSFHIIYLRSIQEEVNILNGTSVILSRTLPPHTSVNQAISIRTENVPENTQIQLSYFVENQEKRVITPNQIIVSRFGTFVHSIIEVFLLPPLANGIIPLIAFASVVLLEDRIIERRDWQEDGFKSTNGWKRRVFDALFWSVRTLGANVKFIWASFFVNLRAWLSILVCSLLLLLTFIWSPIWTIKLFEHTKLGAHFFLYLFPPVSCLLIYGIALVIAGNPRVIQVNINQADLKQLQDIPGIRTKRANAIIKYRKQRSFNSYADVEYLFRTDQSFTNDSKLFNKVLRYIVL